MSDIESESLPAHVSICQQRYLHLETRIHSVEERMEKIETILLDIHHKIDALTHRHHQRWNQTQIGVIGLLLAVSGYLLSLRLFQ